MPSVLMVCLGNICRSPMAEAVFRHLVQARPDGRDWSVDSAGTGPWHVGSPPYRHTLEVLKTHGITTNHRGRLVCPEDFALFDLILGMDGENLADLRKLAPAGNRAEIRLLGDFDPEGVRVVADPYGKPIERFHELFVQVERACHGLIIELDRRRLGRRP